MKACYMIDSHTCFIYKKVFHGNAFLLLMPRVVNTSAGSQRLTRHSITRLKKAVSSST